MYIVCTVFERSDESAGAGHVGSREARSLDRHTRFVERAQSAPPVPVLTPRPLHRDWQSTPGRSGDGGFAMRLGMAIDRVHNPPAIDPNPVPPSASSSQPLAGFDFARPLLQADVYGVHVSLGVHGPPSVPTQFWPAVSGPLSTQTTSTSFGAARDSNPEAAADAEMEPDTGSVSRLRELQLEAHRLISAIAGRLRNAGTQELVALNETLDGVLRALHAADAEMAVEDSDGRRRARRTLEAIPAALGSALNEDLVRAIETLALVLDEMNAGHPAKFCTLHLKNFAKRLSVSGTTHGQCHIFDSEGEKCGQQINF